MKPLTGPRLYAAMFLVVIMATILTYALKEYVKRHPNSVVTEKSLLVK